MTSRQDKVETIEKYEEGREFIAERKIVQTGNIKMKMVMVKNYLKKKAITLFEYRLMHLP